MNTRRCLVIDPMHESLFPMLTDIGWEADYRPNISREKLKEILSGYAGLIVRSKTIIDRDLLGPSPTIKFVGRAGAGLDILDLPYLAEKGIHVLHASEGNRDAVGEYTIGTLLALMRKIPKADKEVKDMVWDREANRGEEVMGKTVGVIGYGNMGQAFAQRLWALDVRYWRMINTKKVSARPNVEKFLWKRSIPKPTLSVSTCHSPMRRGVW